MTIQISSDTKSDLYSIITDIETLALLVDLDIVEENIDQYVSAPHVCLIINFYYTLSDVQQDLVEQVWDTQARGKVQ